MCYMLIQNRLKKANQNEKKKKGTWLPSNSRCSIAECCFHSAFIHSAFLRTYFAASAPPKCCPFGGLLHSETLLGALATSDWQLSLMLAVGLRICSDVPVSHAGSCLKLFFSLALSDSSVKRGVLPGVFSTSLRPFPSFFWDTIFKGHKVSEVFFW